VALKIAPVYGGPVVWMKDASQNALVAAKLMNEKEEKQLARELNDQYEQMRVEYNEEQEKLLTLDEARKNKLDLFNE
jgi:5-methyltetrahydrofolate--homocysteine methyltransferase